MPDWKPDGAPSLSPYLACADPEAEIAFLEAAFGGEVTLRMAREDGALMHAEVRIDDSVVMLGGAPGAPPNDGVMLHLYVPRVATAYAEALLAGGVSVQEPMRKGGGDDDLRAGVRGPNGETWWIATAGPEPE